MPQTPRLLLALLAALATVACQASPPAPLPPFQLEKLGSGSLVVRVAPQAPSYRALYLPVADWDFVEGVLTHANPGVAEQRVRAEAVIDEATGRRAATLTFAGLRAGAGYRLTVTLYRANGEADPIVVSTESLEAPGILSGVNALMLDRLFKQVAPAGAAPGSLLKGMVTSLPEAGMHARLDTPTDVVVDAQGFVYVCDTEYTGTIRRLAPDAAGRWWMTNLAGTGYIGNGVGELHVASFNKPAGMALAGEGLLYVVDAGSKALRRVTFDALGKGAVATVTVKMAAGEPGAGANASTIFTALTGVAVGTGGVLFVSDATRIFKLTPDALTGFTASVYVGGALAGYEDGSGTQAKFNGLRDMVIDAQGVIYASDASNHRIRRIAPNGGVGSASTMPMPAGISFSSPAGMTFDAEGRLIVGDAKRLYRITPDAPGGPTGEELAGAATAGFADGLDDAARFSDLSGLAPAADGGFWVVDKANHRLRKVTPAEGRWQVSTRAGDGIPGRMNGPAGAEGPLQRPTGVAIAPDGTIVIADAAAHKIMAIDPAGTSVRVLAGTGAAGGQNGAGATATFNGPSSVSRLADGSFLIVDTGSGALRRLRLGEDGLATVSTVATGFQYPGAAIEGPDGALYVAESGFPHQSLWQYIGKHRISKVVLSAAGAPTITVLAGDGPGFVDGSGSAARFKVPTGMAFGPDGALYVADAKGHRIRKLVFDGAGQATVSTLAGDGNVGAGGATFATARFDQPTGLAFDPQGRLVVTDYFNHRLQALSLGDATVSTIAGTLDGYSDGPVAQARFLKPIALAFDAAGHIIVVEDNTYGVRKVTP